MRRGLGLVGSLRVVVARGLTAAAPAQRRAALLSAGLSFVAGAAYKHVDASACRCQQAPSMLAEADALFDSNRYDSLAKKLRGALAYAPGDAELNWRLGRACKKLADAEKNAKAREALTREGLACADRAVAADPQCGPAHKCVHALSKRMALTARVRHSAASDPLVISRHLSSPCLRSGRAQVVCDHALGRRRVPRHLRKNQELLRRP